MVGERRTWLAFIGAAALLLGLVLSGCGVPSTRIEEPTPFSATAVSTATNDPLPLTTPDPTTLMQKGCPVVPWGPQPQYFTVNGLMVSIPERDVSNDFPSEQMPNDVSSVPYKVPLTVHETQDVGAFRPHPPVNPSFDTGYGVQVCNQKGVAHTISSISVNIASFIPSSGPINIWPICQDGPYDTATKGTTPGCGGEGLVFVDGLEAKLPTDRTGAKAPALAAPPPAGQYQAGGANLPTSLKPNQALDFMIAVSGLTSQGTYLLSFSVSIDGGAPATLAPSDGSFLIAPAATVWTGTACQTPAMQAQIPPSNQDTFYVCPPAS